jgi:hypothetical protein
MRHAKTEDGLVLACAVNLNGGCRRSRCCFPPLQWSVRCVLLRCVRNVKGCRLGMRALGVHPPRQHRQHRARGRAAKKVTAICHQPRPYVHNSNVLPYHDRCGNKVRLHSLEERRSVPVAMTNGAHHTLLGDALYHGATEGSKAPIAVPKVEYEKP